MQGEKRSDHDGTTGPTRPGVLLDVDGTLLDSSYLHAVAWRRAFRDAGHDGVTTAQTHAAEGLPGADLVRHLLGHDDEDVVAGHARHFEETKHLVTALPGAADLLRACASRGAAVVLTTSGSSGDLGWMVPLLGGDEAQELLAGVITSEDVDAGKPSPDPLSSAVQRHGLDPGRTVVVGDSVWDVAAAVRAGLPCVGLRCGGIGEAELRGAGAVSVREHPADLLEHLGDLDRALGG